MSVEVKQSDREAAASVLPPFVRAEVLAGKHDTAGDCSATVQAFAAHRRQAEEAMRERCAKRADGFDQLTEGIIAQDGFDDLEAGHRMVIGCMKQTAMGIAAAIRGMEVE